MNLVNPWRASRTNEPRRGACLALVWCCLQPLLAQDTADLRFVKIVAATPGVYAPPGRPAPGESLGLKVTGLPAPRPAQLRIYALVNRGVDRAVANNQMISLGVLGTADLQRMNLAKDPADIVVPLPMVDIPNTLELTAILTDAKGVPVSPMARLTLDQAASVQASPSLLQKALAGGSALLDRLMNIYDDVRGSPEARSVFVVSLERGKPIPAPAALPLPRAQYRGLALSPEGRTLAWVVAEPGHYELWISKVEDIAPVKIASSPGAILTPRFADEKGLLYSIDSSLSFAEIEGQVTPRAVLTPFRLVAGINFAKRTGDGIECIVSAEHPDAPGLRLPYLLKISLPGLQAHASRLPLNPFYGSYSLLVDGAPFFFAGWNGGVEGIHYFQPDSAEGRVSRLYKVHSPGLVALAANGSRLVFAGSK